MLPCVYAKSHKTERDRWDVIKDGTIYKNGLRRARKASLYFAGEESKYFIWTFVDQRQLLAQKSTREIQTGEQVTASSPLLLETGCI